MNLVLVNPLICFCDQLSKTLLIQTVKAAWETHANKT